MNNIYKKSTLQAWNLSAQAAAVNDVLKFNNSQKTGCAVEFANGTGSVTIRKPGLYQIAFNGIAVESGTAGDVAVQLQKKRRRRARGYRPGNERQCYCGSKSGIRNDHRSAAVLRMRK